MLDSLFVLLQYCLPQHAISRLAGKLANTTNPKIKNFLIEKFASHYKVDLSEAQEPNCQNYPTFNQFFTRALKPSARSIDASHHSIVSPADGAISEMGSLTKDKLLQAKGRHYTLNELLADDVALAQEFYNGQFATIYLSPKDYHRVHMPCDGKLVKTIYIPGKLFSVNNATVNRVPNLFARNERLVCAFQTQHGPMLLILVGAMIVSGISVVWEEQAPAADHIVNKYHEKPISLKKGEEMGRFHLGSTVIILLPRNAMQWLDSLSSADTVRMGQLLGKGNVNTDSDVQGELFKQGTLH